MLVLESERILVTRSAVRVDFLVTSALLCCRHVLLLCFGFCCIPRWASVACYLTCSLSGPLPLVPPAPGHVVKATGNCNRAVTCPLPLLRKVLQPSCPVWGHGFTTFFFAWSLTLLRPGRFPFPLILTCAQLSNFCQSAGFQVALCFKVHSSDHQELGEFFCLPERLPFL